MFANIKSDGIQRNIFLPRWHTVRTVAADLRQGEHIPKMQNNIGRKSMLRVLRQPIEVKGWGGAACRTVPSYRAALGPALGSAELP
jgi:hypothetical protein